MTIRKDSTSNSNKRLNRSQREPDRYDLILGDISHVINAAKRSAARSINCIMTAAYWMIGQRMVEFEQKGRSRAAYGEEILGRLSIDLSQKFGRGFSRQNIQQMRQFYLLYPPERICQTPSGKLENSSRPMICQTPSGVLPAAYMDMSLSEMAPLFPLPWSAYVRLLAVRNEHARRFYETEALRGGWSVRQLDRQINAQFYERTALSRNKAIMLTKGQNALPEDGILPEEEIKEPYVLEFLGLKDEYSESELEEALIKHLENFLLELGGDFCFIGRQKRLRVGDEWYRVDLLFFHRRLHCLVIVDLKLGKFTHADAGQMHLYLNYARENWARPDENPPVGLILCARNDESLARYTLENLPNKVMASEYRTALPDEKKLAAEIERTQGMLQDRKRIALASSKVKKKTKRASDICR